MAWLETASETFVARHDARDEAEAERVLAQLEYARPRLQKRLEADAGELSVVIHPSITQLDAAAPWLVLQRALTAPAGRRYLVGWATRSELHVLTPRLLAQRASNVEGSLELLMLTPSALLAKRLLGVGGRAALKQLGTGAWRVEGAAQFFSGQTRHVRPAVVARLRNGSLPSFPPGRRDAALLGGTVFDLLAREEGEHACVALARDGRLEHAFGGRPMRQSEQAWRSHLARLGSG